MSDDQPANYRLRDPGWFWRVIMRPHRLDVERLASEIAHARSRQLRDAPDNREIERLIKCANDALRRNNHFVGWDHVRRIRELFIQDSQDPRLLRFEAIELEKEARAKIDKGRDGADAWRRESILALLVPILNECMDMEEVKARLLQAMRLRDGHFDNLHRKNRYWQYATNVVCLVMAGVIVLLVVLFLYGALGAATQQQDGDSDRTWLVILTVVLFGVLGASFSTLRALTADPARYTKVRIPQQFLDLSSVMRRLFIGAGAALIAYLLALRIDDLEGTSLIYLAAFAAGFSDNLVEKGISSVQGKIGGGS